LPAPAGPERSCRAINLTSAATFAAKVFVRSVDHAAARKQDEFDAAQPGLEPLQWQENAQKSPLVRHGGAQRLQWVPNCAGSGSWRIQMGNPG